MNAIAILLISLIALPVGVVSVSVGGTSLIIVPLLIWFGLSAKNAIATNMFALVFLSISGAIGFKEQLKPAHYRTVLILTILTIIGSFLGAILVLAVNEHVLKILIAVIMCLITATFFLKKDLGTYENTMSISKIRFILGCLLTFILGIHGGFFSGGYVTLLSYVLILTFGFSFLQVAFITKVLNIFSSIAACVFFLYHGLIVFPVAIPLAIFMYAGAFFGAKLAIAKGNIWLRNIYIAAVIVLALKLLLF